MVEHEKRGTYKTFGDITHNETRENYFISSAIRGPNVRPVAGSYPLTHPDYELGRPSTIAAVPSVFNRRPVMAHAGI